MKCLGAFFLVLGSTATAEATRQEESHSARFLTIDFAAGIRSRMPTADDTSQSLLLAPGETIRFAAVSNPQVYSVTTWTTKDSLTVRTIGTAAPATLRIRSDMRSYEIELVPATAHEVPYVVSFNYLAEASPVAVASTPQSTYQQHGNSQLLPTLISDDGHKTYMQWHDDQPMPAVFAIGPSGGEEMVDGYMRDGVFTIDSVYSQFIFRIDGAKATAKRFTRRGGRK